MKIKLITGNTKLKISFEGNPSEGNPNGWDKLLRSLVSKIDADTLNKTYSKIPANNKSYYDEMSKIFANQILSNENLPGLINFYEDASKAWEKLINANKKNDAGINDNLDVLPANGHDIYNYFARFGIANFQIQIIMKVDGKLDFDKLAKAVRLSVDAEPVFGCRLVENDPPYWKRLDNIDEIKFCTIEETDNTDEAVQKFLETPLDMDKDPMVKVRLIRSGDYDTICIKLNHSCCDGTGAKEYLKLISDIYTCIYSYGVYEPKPRVRSRKDQDRLFDALGIKDPETAWDPLLEVPKTMWKFPWKYGKPENVRVIVHELPGGLLELLSGYGKARGATINDLILTAFYRSMFQISQPFYGIPMDISMTVDLRRYLPDQKIEAIRNFSGGFDTRLSRVAYETFEGTLSRVSAMMDTIKSGRPGLQSAIGLERVEKMSMSDTRSYFQIATACSDIASIMPVFCGDLCSPVLSNLGFISRDLFHFGKSAVTKAYIVPPAVRAPGYLLLACTYNGVMTLCVSYYESILNREDAEKVLVKIGEELVEGLAQ